MVAAPCLRFAQAALWKGQAPQSTTGVARFSDSHCQLSNWRAGIMAISSTGSESSPEMISRRRSGAVGSSPASSRSAVPSAEGSVALYPSASTAPTSTSGSTAAGSYRTVARSVA